ncbi:ALQxL family class IV lanthipeptide [Streptomyces sp. DSM 41972]|uniref:ALQxL family class IV lanthipeptide n=1 Tax=Streptomyces althioticus subsp. attaecolombicae TaxID=3075534 RepID=A0ABU3I3V3_9ACTN|nr:ALQxL family class IV lanthipeptide [Streptomyces sp. DSM 41972]SCE11604.1 hypothetical protein GA0115238_15327 [Streptomyces sp. di50b]SCE46679.1 hypothetical protein GA0115245_14078 [Streptomyces sp. di188]
MNIDPDALQLLPDGGSEHDSICTFTCTESCEKTCVFTR